MIKSTDDTNCQVLNCQPTGCVGIDCITVVAYLSTRPRNDFMGRLLGQCVKAKWEWDGTL